METSARYVLIGVFTLTVVFATFGFVYWVQGAGGSRERTIYRVQFENSVAGLVKGAAVLFNGIHVGEVTGLELDQTDPRRVIATLALDAGTPVHADTRVGIDFQGLMGGVANVSLTGGSPNSAIMRGTGREPPLLTADPAAGTAVTQAARELVQHIDTILSDNAEPLHSAITNIDTFSGTLARNSARIDAILAGLERMTAGGPPKVAPIHDLTAPHAFPAVDKPPHGLLAVPEPTAAIILDSQRILVRSSTGETSPMPNAEWSDNLTRLFQARVVQSFENAGYLQQVARATDLLQADRQLVLDIRKFEVTDGPDAVADVEFSAKIMAEGRISAARIFHAAVPAKAKDAATMTAAMDQAFGMTATDLVLWTIGNI